jgi:hypothetical protein
VTFILNAVDLQCMINGSAISKHVDEVYLLAPASNTSSESLQLDHIEVWAKANNA